MAGDIADVVEPGLPRNETGSLERGDYLWNLIDSPSLNPDVAARGQINNFLSHFIRGERQRAPARTSSRRPGCELVACSDRDRACARKPKPLQALEVVFVDLVVAGSRPQPIARIPARRRSRACAA